MINRWFAVATVFTVLVISAARGQIGGGYDLSWSALRGSGTSTNSNWSISGTTGQSEAAKSAGANWAVQGGFWNRVSGNLAPSPKPVTLSRAKDVLAKIRISELVTNAVDPDGEAVFYFAGTSATSTNGGTISTNATHVLYVQPASNGNLTDQFTYKLKDGFQGLGVGTITITVTNAVSSVGTLTITNSSVVVSFAGIPGFGYQIQRSTNLVDWATRFTTNAPTSGVFEFMDDFGDLGSPPSQAYYRLRQP